MARAETRERGVEDDVPEIGLVSVTSSFLAILLVRFECDVMDKIVGELSIYHAARYNELSNRRLGFQGLGTNYVE